VLALMREIAPQSALEGLLAVQMITTPPGRHGSEPAWPAYGPNGQWVPSLFEYGASTDDAVQRSIRYARSTSG
jgi:hypothetical protein